MQQDGSTYNNDDNAHHNEKMSGRYQRDNLLAGNLPIYFKREVVIAGTEEVGRRYNNKESDHVDLDANETDFGTSILPIELHFKLNCLRFIYLC